MRNTYKDWKNPSILLFSIGISQIGNFIYLVAINIIVYQLTSSAAAVAGLWMIGPLTSVVTKFWTGSFIDYRSKRRVMMITYIVRALFIGMIPFAPHMIVVYGILIILSIAQSFFNPASMTYMTLLITKEKRKRFNSIRSFASSGAFITGPAVGGALILLTSINTTLWINAMFFVISAMLLWLLPEKEVIEKEAIPRLTISQVIRDFTVVMTFVNRHKYVSFVYLGFIIVMVFTFAMDAQEVVFVQRVIGLTEFDYSLLISITGIGSVIGAILLSIFSHRFSLRYMISVGILMVSIGYLLYAFSWSFASIVIGFVTIGFFNAFFNAGITTFYQNNIPVNIMGRVTSVFQLIQSALQVIFILLVGILADLISLRITIVVLALIMFISALVLFKLVFKKNKMLYYNEEKL